MEKNKTETRKKRGREDEEMERGRKEADEFLNESPYPQLAEAVWLSRYTLKNVHQPKPWALARLSKEALAPPWMFNQPAYPQTHVVSVG